MKRISLYLIIIFILNILFYTGCSSLPIFRSEDSTDCPQRIIDPNGEYYNACAHRGWIPLKNGNSIGKTEWSNVTVYEVHGDKNKNIIMLKEPLSEFWSYYAKESFKFPEININDIDGVEWVDFPFKGGNKVINDKKIISNIIDIISLKIIENVSLPIESPATLYLYSNKIPGCVFKMDIYLQNETYYLDIGNTNLTRINAELCKLLKK